MTRKKFTLLITLLFNVLLNAEELGPNNPPIQPYRAFITIQRYNVENNGEPTHPISNVKLEITFPNKKTVELPGQGQYWPIGNGQVQEINRTYEIPWEMITNDGFKFAIQMIRKGSKMDPCQFEIVQLSQFNRSYICRTDINWQMNQKTPEEKLDKEGIQIRVFTNRNSAPSEIPAGAIAIR